MSYIRFAYGLHHVKGASDSYIISTSDSKGKCYINSYGLGDLGMAELICDAIDDRWKDDPLFADWFKKRVAKRLGVELREKKISFDQSLEILERKRDAKTLKKFSKKEMAENEARKTKEGLKLEKELDELLKRPRRG